MAWSVEGAGDTSYNGIYEEAGTHDSEPYYTYESGSGTRYLFWSSMYSIWSLDPELVVGPQYYGTGSDLPANPWTASLGTSPAPTVSEATVESDDVNDGQGIKHDAAFNKEAVGIWFEGNFNTSDDISVAIYDTNFDLIQSNASSTNPTNEEATNSKMYIEFDNKITLSAYNTYYIVVWSDSSFDIDTGGAISWTGVYGDNFDTAFSWPDPASLTEKSDVNNIFVVEEEEQNLSYSVRGLDFLEQNLSYSVRGLDFLEQNLSYAVSQIKEQNLSYSIIQPSPELLESNLSYGPRQVSEKEQNISYSIDNSFEFLESGLAYSVRQIDEKEQNISYAVAFNFKSQKMSYTVDGVEYLESNLSYAVKTYSELESNLSYAVAGLNYNNQNISYSVRQIDEKELNLSYSIIQTDAGRFFTIINLESHYM